MKLEELEAYLATPKIECLLCHRSFHKLDPHLRRTHGTTTEDYREEFGIPITVGLVGADQRVVMSNAQKHYLEDTNIVQDRIADLLKATEGARAFFKNGGVKREVPQEIRDALNAKQRGSNAHLRFCEAFCSCCGRVFILPHPAYARVERGLPVCCGDRPCKNLAHYWYMEKYQGGPVVGNSKRGKARTGNPT